MNKIIILILAAGSSSRLGQPKQLLKINGISLIEKMANEALQLIPKKKVIVVTGSQANKIKNQLNNHTVDIIKNPNWQDGMGSTISFGVTHILQHFPDTEAVIIMACDQPFLTNTILQELISKWHESRQEIIACEYGDSFGIPALFSKKLMPELMAIKDEKGGKKVIKKNIEKTAFVEFENGDKDIDTVDDLQWLD